MTPYLLVVSYLCFAAVCYLRLDEKAAGCYETSVYSHLSACRRIPTALLLNWRTLFLNCEQMHLRELLMSVDSSHILPHCLPEDMYASVFRCDQSAIMLYLRGVHVDEWRIDSVALKRVTSATLEKLTGGRDGDYWRQRLIACWRACAEPSFRTS